MRKGTNNSCIPQIYLAKNHADSEIFMPNFVVSPKFWDESWGGSLAFVKKKRAKKGRMQKSPLIEVYFNTPAKKMPQFNANNSSEIDEIAAMLYNGGCVKIA